jgi:hypothetical protein
VNEYGTFIFKGQLFQEDYLMFEGEGTLLL